MDSNGVRIVVGVLARMLVGPDNHPVEGRVIHVFETETVIDCGNGLLFTRPHNNVTVLS